MSIGIIRRFVKQRICGAKSGLQLSCRKPSLVCSAVCSTLLSISGCVSTGGVPHQIAIDSGFEERRVSSRRFEHIVYESNLHDKQGGDLKVYIEGDGTPWLYGKVPANDPTPRNPLALRLMAQDPTAAVYIGRPCYFGLSSSRNCSSDNWTSGRYSEAVIASMHQVIEHYAEMFGFTRLILIGYSGGGAIATLLARDSTVPTFVLTIAGNLNTDAWTTARGFIPLDQSLNPIDFIDQLRDVPQLHLIAVDDQTVPPFVTRSYADQLPARFSRSYPDIDHNCCWEALWPFILREAPWNT